MLNHHRRARTCLRLARGTSLGAFRARRAAFLVVLGTGILLLALNVLAMPYSGAVRSGPVALLTTWPTACAGGYQDV